MRNVRGYLKGVKFEPFEGELTPRKVGYVGKTGLKDAPSLKDELDTFFLVSKFLLKTTARI